MDRFMTNFRVLNSGIKYNKVLSQPSVKMYPDSTKQKPTTKTKIKNGPSRTFLLYTRENRI